MINNSKNSNSTNLVITVIIIIIMITVLITLIMISKLKPDAETDFGNILSFRPKSKGCFGQSKLSSKQRDPNPNIHP